MTSKKHATGKGNAKKPEMQAEAKARWGKDLSEDEDDAAFVGAYVIMPTRSSSQWRRSLRSPR